MRQTSRTIRISVAAALGLVSATALGAPTVKSVYKTYSTAGTLTCNDPPVSAQVRLLKHTP